MIGVDDLPIVEEIREHILNQEPVATQVYLIDIHPIDNLGLLQQFVQVALRVDRRPREPTQHGPVGCIHILVKANLLNVVLVPILHPLQ